MSDEYLLAKVARLEADLSAMRGAARAVVDIYDVYPTRGWRELATLRGVLRGGDDQTGGIYRPDDGADEMYVGD